MVNRIIQSTFEYKVKASVRSSVSAPNLNIKQVKKVKGRVGHNAVIKNRINKE